MSHEVETMAWAGEVPWHGLGTKIENPETTTLEEWRTLAGLDWDVYKLPDYVEIEGEFVLSGTEKLIRDVDNAIFSTVSEEWNPFTVEQHFDFFRELCEEGGMQMHTCGSLKGGRIIWALAKITNEGFELFGGDRVDSQLLLTNFFIYGRATDVRFTPIRVVCNNTLSLAINKAVENMIKVSHRHEFDPAVVKDMLGIATEKLESYKLMAQFLGERRAKKDKLVEFFGDVFPGAALKNKEEIERDPDRAKLGRVARQAYDALEQQPGAEFAEGSWWQAFNAVTFTVDHLQGRSNDTRMESAWYGNGMRKKNAALQKAVEYAETA